ncbi:MAG: hypothetical protein M3O32_06275, partial [Actinomycetota bacterium]|nr:hypothetical protein [Actinomycetota bacterium]
PAPAPGAPAPGAPDSVPDGAGAIVVSVDGAVVVVVDVLDEVLLVLEPEPLSLLPHATVSVPTANAAAMPAATRNRRELRSAIMSGLDSVGGVSPMGTSRRLPTGMRCQSN